MLARGAEPDRGFWGWFERPISRAIGCRFLELSVTQRILTGSVDGTPLATSRRREARGKSPENPASMQV